MFIITSNQGRTKFKTASGQKAKEYILTLVRKGVSYSVETA